MGQITSVKQSGNLIAVTSRPVKALDAFTSIHYDNEIGLSNINYSRMSNSHQAPPPKIGANLDGSITLELQDEISVGNIGSVGYDVFLELAGGLHILADDGNVSVTISPKASLKGTIQATLNGQIGYNDTKVHLGSFPLMVSPSNVLFTPTINIYAFLESGGKISVAAEIDASASSQIGFEVYNGQLNTIVDGEKPSAEKIFNFTKLEGEVKAGLGVRELIGVSLLGRPIWDFEATYAEQMFSVEGNFSISPQQSAYENLMSAEVKMELRAGVYARLHEWFMQTGTVGTIQASRDAKFEFCKMHLVPEFGNFTSRTDNATIVTTRATRDVLLPCNISLALYSKSGTKLGQSPYEIYYEESSFGNPLTAHFIGLTPGETYTVHPIVNLFGYDIMASPAYSFTIGKDDLPDDPDDPDNPNNPSSSAATVLSEKNCNYKLLNGSNDEVIIDPRCELNGHVIVPSMIHPTEYEFVGFDQFGRPIYRDVVKHYTVKGISSSSFYCTPSDTTFKINDPKMTSYSLPSTISTSHIKVYAVYADFKSLSDIPRNVKNIYISCPKLVTLNLISNNLNNISISCPKLVTLNIMSNNLNDVDISCPKIVTLNIMSNNLNGGVFWIDTDYITLCTDNVKSFSISESKRIKLHRNARTDFFSSNYLQGITWKSYDLELLDLKNVDFECFFDNSLICNIENLYMDNSSIFFTDIGTLNSKRIILKNNSNINSIYVSYLAKTDLLILDSSCTNNSIKPHKLEYRPTIITTDPWSLGTLDPYEYNNAYLEEVIIREGATVIPQFFIAGASLPRWSIPSDAHSIHHGAFLCSNLSNINIPNSVDSIYGCAFRDTPLKSIILPNSVSAIAFLSFFFCPLKQVVSKASTPPQIFKDNFRYRYCADQIDHNDYYNYYNYDYYNNAFDWETLNNAVLYVPKGSLELYKRDKYWGLFKHIQPIEDGHSDDNNTPLTGDVTGDGKVDVEDVNAIINQILKIGTPSSPASDINDDGKVDVEDVNAIINMILNV